MNHAHFRVHGDLNFFLPRAQKNIVIDHPFDWRGSVKDMIESLGIPHPEVDLITANEVSVDFNYIVLPDDQIDVYSNREDATLSLIVPLRPVLAGCPSFVLDQHLGRLAAYLRMMGFDTLYRNDYHDEELAQVSHDQDRVLLTRDIGLLKRSIVIYGYFVRETNRERQLAEIIRRFSLSGWSAPFKHCMKCNGLLKRIDKSAILAYLPAGTAQHYEEFHRCDSCNQVYWKGPHYQQMQALMAKVLNQSHS